MYSQLPKPIRPGGLQPPPKMGLGMPTNPYAAEASRLAASGGLPTRNTAAHPTQSLPTAPPTTPAGMPKAPQRPAQSANPIYMDALQGVARGKGTGAGGVNRYYRQLGVGLSHQYLPQLHEALARLYAQSDPENLAGEYAPAFEALGDRYDRAEGALDQNLAARGLTDSAAMAGGQGALAAGRASASAGLAANIQQEARARGDQFLQAVSELVYGRPASMSLGAAEGALNRKLQASLADGSGWDAILGLLGEVGGGLGTGVGQGVGSKIKF